MSTGHFNYSNSSVYDLWCPEGFVFPDDPSNPLNEWVTNSSCAVACIKPVYTQATYSTRQKEYSLMSWIGAISVVLLLVTHLRDGKSLSYLTLCTLFLTFVNSLMFVVAGQTKIEKQFCLDNSVTITQSDGITFCSVESVVCCYTGVGIVIAW